MLIINILLSYYKDDKFRVMLTSEISNKLACFQVRISILKIYIFRTLFSNSTDFLFNVVYLLGNIIGLYERDAMNIKLKFLK